MRRSACRRVMIGMSMSPLAVIALWTTSRSSPRRAYHAVFRGQGVGLDAIILCMGSLINITFKEYSRGCLSLCWSIANPGLNNLNTLLQSHGVRRITAPITYRHLPVFNFFFPDNHLKGCPVFFGIFYLFGKGKLPAVNVVST